jgi:hypothetical protein
MDWILCNFILLQSPIVSAEPNEIKSRGDYVDAHAEEASVKLILATIEENKLCHRIQKLEIPTNTPFKLVSVNGKRWF